MEEYLTKADLIKSWAEADIKRGIDPETAKKNAVDTWNEIEQFNVDYENGKYDNPVDDPLKSGSLPPSEEELKEEEWEFASDVEKANRYTEEERVEIERKAYEAIWATLSETEKRIMILEQNISMYQGLVEETASEWRTTRDKEKYKEMKMLQERVRKWQSKLKELKTQNQAELTNKNTKSE